MKPVIWSIVSAVCLLQGVPAGAEDETPDLLAQMKGEATPEIVKWVQADDEKAKPVAEKVAGDPAALAAVGALIAGDARRFVKRDGEAAEAFADWLVDVARDARKKDKRNPDACAAFGNAWLANARVGVAADKRVGPEGWIQAADMLIERAGLLGGDRRLGDAYKQALEILHEGAVKEGASVHRLFDHASVIGPKGVAALPEDEALRRAVADSFKKQAYEMYEVSKRRMQAAIRGYFDAFGPLVRTQRRRAEDARAFNAMVTLGREEDLDLKEDYVTKPTTVLRGLLAVELPETGRWRKSGNKIDRGFDVADVFRFVDFGVYEWDSVYGFEDAVRDVGGDNVKGVANLNYLRRLELFRSVKRKRKPSRARFSKRLPMGIRYSIEGKDKSGDPLRITGFFVKAVKAEKTIRILIVESAGLEVDPETKAVYESFDITKKSR